MAALIVRHAFVCVCVCWSAIFAFFVCVCVVVVAAENRKRIRSREELAQSGWGHETKAEYRKGYVCTCRYLHM